jgi:hypothetical protein
MFSFLVLFIYLVLLSFTINPYCDEMSFSFPNVSIIACWVRAVINMSSAYAKHCFSRVDILPLISLDAFDLPNFVITSLHSSETPSLRRVWTIPELHGGPGGVVGIANGYGLDGPRIESRWKRDFPHLSKPALGPTQLPVQWVPGLSRA